VISMNMKRRMYTVLGGVIITGSLAAVPAFAAPGDHGNGVGGCISGNLYGNTSNPRPSGNGTLPSQSPGPSVNNPTDPSHPTPGPSMGDVQPGTHDLFGSPSGNYTGRDVAQAACNFQ
jgi:hypothetical protein